MPSSTYLELMPLSSPPQSLHTVIESSSGPPHYRRVLPWSLHHRRPWAGDAIDHTGHVPKPVMSFLSSQQCHPPWACDTVHPASFPTCDADDTHCPRARSTIVLLEPATSRARDAVKPMLSLSPNFVILPKPATLHCIFFFVILGLQILILITTLPHCFDMLRCFCSAVLFWCATLPHCFDIRRYF
jgi:hypothetical protein